jgi:uncharacterized protein involved in exopolysaccharide biosynthesis
MSAVRTARDRLDRIVTILWRAARFWPAATLVVLIGTVASIGYTFTRHRVYHSETVMLYREGIRSSDVGGFEGGGDPARKLALKLKEMVLSRTRLQQIIDENKLYQEIVADRGYVDAVDEMRGHISFRVKDGDTFGLSFEGDDPARVQAITARLAVALIDENSKHRAEQAEATKEFLDAERKRVEDELREKEAALAKFLAKHPEFAREGTTGSSAALRTVQAKTQKGGGTDPTLLALEREAARLQERLGMPVAKKNKESQQSDPKLVAAKTEAENDLHAAQRELADKLAQFTDQHPDVKAARTKVKAAETKLKRAQDALLAADASQNKPPPEEEATIDRATLESQLAKVQEEISAYKKKKTRVENETDENKSAPSWIVALETEWSQLSRDVQEARTRTTNLTEKQFKASISENASQQGRNAVLEVIDPAYRPTHPSKPSRSMLLLIGLLLSIGLGLATALTLALLDDRLYDRMDVEKLDLLPLLAVVPKAPKEVRIV